MTLDAPTVRTVLGMVQGPRIDDDAWVHDVTFTEDETGIDLTVTIGAEERPGVPIAEARQDLYTRLGARPDVAVRVPLDQPPIRRIAARVAQVPGFGWRPSPRRPLTHPVDRLDRGERRSRWPTAWSPCSSTRPTARSRSTASAGSGDWSTGAISAIPTTTRRLAPTPGSTDRPRSASPSARRARSGPRRWSRPSTSGPTTSTGRRRSGSGHHEVEVTTSSRSERTSRWSGWPRRSSTPPGTTAYGSISPSRPPPPPRRPSAPSPPSPGGSPPRADPTSRAPHLPGPPVRLGRRPDRGPRRRLSSTSWSTSTEGDEPRATALALTLLRSTGMLSRLGMSYRPFPAGPLTPVEGLQMVGTGSRTATPSPWATSTPGPWPTTCSSRWRRSRRSAAAPAAEWQRPGGRGAEVSSVRRTGGALEVRVFNPAGEPTTVRLGTRTGWLVDLRGRPTQSFEGSFELRGHRHRHRCCLRSGALAPTVRSALAEGWSSHSARAGRSMSDPSAWARCRPAVDDGGDLFDDRHLDAVRPCQGHQRRRRLHALGDHLHAGRAPRRGTAPGPARSRPSGSGSGGWCRWPRGRPPRPARRTSDV